MNRNKILVAFTLIILLTCLAVWYRGITRLVASRPQDTIRQSVPEKVFPRPRDTVYRMALKIDPLNRMIYGRSIITTRNTTGCEMEEAWFTCYPNALRDKKNTPAPPEAYYDGFSPGWLNITGIVVNGKRAVYEDKGMAGRVVFPQPVDSGKEICFVINWQTGVPKAAYRFGSKDGVMMLGHCYPILNVFDAEGWHTSYNSTFGDPFYTQSADYVVQATLPEQYQVVGTGIVAGRSAEDNGLYTVQFNAGKARDFTLAVLFDYREETIGTGETAIKCYFRPGCENSAAQVLRQAASALRYYDCTFGSYPFAEFKIIQAPMKGFQGMEYSGLILLADEVFQTGYSQERRAFLVAHETAHQWWYGLVGNDQVREPWLDEGLATWSATRYQQWAQAGAKPGPGRRGAELQKGLGEMSSREKYFDTAYLGGEAFWYALEDEIGQQQVLKVLRSYLAKFRYETATTADLRAVIEKESGRNMKTFFSNWFSL